MNRRERQQARQKDEELMLSVEELVRQNLRSDAMTLTLRMRTAHVRGLALALVLSPLPKKP